MERNTLSPRREWGWLGAPIFDETSSAIADKYEDVIIVHSSEGKLAVDVDGSQYGDTEVLDQLESAQASQSQIQPLAATSGKCGTVNRYSYSLSGSFWNGKAYNRDLHEPSYATNHHKM